MLQGDGDEFLHGSMPGVEAEGVGRADKRRMQALLVEGVTLPDDVGFALSAAALGPDLGIGIEIEFVGRLRKDHGADVAAFHDQRSLPGQVLLLGNEKLADGGNLRDEGDAFVDPGFADVGEGVEAGDAENEFAFVEAGFDPGGLDFPRDGFGVGERDVLLLEIPGDAPVHRASVDVDVTEALGELARKSAFAGSGGAVNGDNGMKQVGHQADKRSAPRGRQKKAHRAEGGCEFKNS